MNWLISQWQSHQLSWKGGLLGLEYLEKASYEWLEIWGTFGKEGCQYKWTV